MILSRSFIYNMKYLMAFSLLFLTLLFGVGCETGGSSQQNTGTPTTVSGYVSVGGQKTLK